MVVQELIAKLGFDVDQGGLNSVDNALGNFAKKLTIAAAGIYAVKKAVEATVWGISESINAAAQKEDVTAQFKVMLGDLEAAKYLYQEINQYAAVSPFETAGLADNVRTMMSFGQTAKDAFNDIKMLGDVALGDQNKLNRLALVYAQTFSAKKLTGGDLLQYVNAGFNPLEMISKRTGKSIADLRKDMEKGLVSFDMVRQAYIDATAQGGKFYKGAEEGSKTWNGMMSTLRDNIRMLGAELGEKVLPFMKEVLVLFFELWPDIAGAFRSAAESFQIMASTGPDAAESAGAIAAAFMFVADAVMLAMTGFLALKMAVQSFVGILVGFVTILVAFLTAPFVYFLKLIGYVADGLAWLSKKAGLNGASKMASEQAGSARDGAEAFATPGKYLGGVTEGLFGGVGTDWGKFMGVAGKIGTTTEGAQAMKMTKEIEARIAGAASKQPVTINNQTNNLTINADDPMKAMFEPQAARFFQSAFVQLRHATT
jgi:tape measure domain-containing protein